MGVLRHRWIAACLVDGLRVATWANLIHLNGVSDQWTHQVERPGSKCVAPPAVVVNRLDVILLVQLEGVVRPIHIHELEGNRQRKFL